MQSKLDKHSPTPLYHQLKAVILDAILTERWKAGDRLPTETALASQFGVSKITVREAMRELAEMGCVVRQQGRGTFVSKPKLHHGPTELTSFTEELHQRQMTPASRVMQRATIRATGRIAEALGLAEGEPVFLLKRLRLADGEPMAIQMAYVSLAMAPGLEKSSFKNVSLYELLQTSFGLQAARARETYLPAVANAETATLLGIPTGAPVFSVERLTFAPNGKPFEIVHSIMRGDRYGVVLDLAPDRAPQVIREGGA